MDEPALRFNTVPVIALQRSRNTTAWATSSGFTQRLRAVFSAARAINACIRIPVLFDLA